jgi:hypothetical protein
MVVLVAVAGIQALLLVLTKMVELLHQDKVTLVVEVIEPLY